MKKGMIVIILLTMLSVFWYGSRLAKNDYTYDEGYLTAVEDAKICEEEKFLNNELKEAVIIPSKLVQDEVPVEEVVVKQQPIVQQVV